MELSERELVVLIALIEAQCSNYEAFDIVRYLGEHETKLTVVTKIPLDDLMSGRVSERGAVERTGGLIVEMSDKRLVSFTRTQDNERFGYVRLTENGERLARRCCRQRSEPLC